MRLTRQSWRIARFWPWAAASILIAALAGGCGPTNGFPELNGEFAYVANAGDGSISVFSINTTTGALTLIEHVSVKPGFRVFGLALHWSNEFLYATIDDATEVEGFDIGDGGFSGQILAHFGPYAAADGPRAVTLNPKGTYLYATNYGGEADVVSQYTVDQHSGNLTANGTAPTQSRPFGIGVDPSGNCAYVANTGSHSLSQYGITNTGTLDPGAPVSLGGTSDGQGPELLAVQTDPIVQVGSSGRSVYVTDDDLKMVHHLSIGERAIGVTCLLSAPTDYDAKGLAFGIALHPKGIFLYTGNSTSSTISEFSVGLAGNLKFLGQESVNLNDPLSVAIDLQGNFLYAANTNDGTVAQYKINQTTGALTPIGSGKVNTETPANKSSEPVTIVTTVSPMSLVHRL